MWTDCDYDSHAIVYSANGDYGVAIGATAIGGWL